MKDFFKMKRIAMQMMTHTDWEIYFSPGRVNLIGEHIDYNGGLVMPCSLDLGIMGAFHLRSDRIIRCYSHEYSTVDLYEFSLDDLQPKNHWTDYVKGIVKAFSSTIVYGFDLAIMSHLPIGAGLSSSASLELLVATYINDQYACGMSPLNLALISQQVENEFIGVQCGIMDQFAVAMGQKDKAILLNTHTLSYEMVSADFKEYQILIANTSKSRTLAGSIYNERRQECDTILHRLQETMSIQSLCELSLSQSDDCHRLISEEMLFRRLRHVVSEHHRTIESSLALNKQDMKTFGQLLSLSHESLTKDYEVSCIELDTMVNALLKAGAIGARMTGAGFGGCAIALVLSSQISTIVQEVKAAYIQATHLQPEFYVATIGDGTRKIHFSIQDALSSLLDYGIKALLFDACELVYRRNSLLHYFHLTNYEKKPAIPMELDDILDNLVEYARMNHLLLDDSFIGEENFKADVMNLLCETPKDIIQRFNKAYQQSPIHATNFLYTYSKNAHYIQTKNIAKNISWSYPHDYGDFQITINMSKPEKDPMMIKMLREVEESTYPQCQLCVENEGFGGTTTRESRRNMRIVPLMLQNEQWFFQYSPYSYFEEHAIVLRNEHTPMIIQGQTFLKLIDFVRLFPHYFVGSNADFPIVGGSILTHEHFQCGRAKMPIEDASKQFVFQIHNVDVYRLKWPLSTIRLVSKDEKAIAAMACIFLQKWQKYENLGLNIINYPVLHNTITPICRFKEDEWIIDLILRNNVTTKAFPMGVFHPHPQLHHIKKENIGLIEAMGIAILPPRLKRELDLIQTVIFNQTTVVDHPELEKHASWIRELQKQSDVNLKVEVGKKFVEVLEDAGVFKQDFVGQQAFIEFIRTCQ
ncbi:MAG: galactokinase [Bacilli bacterium]